MLQPQPQPQPQPRPQPPAPVPVHVRWRDAGKPGPTAGSLRGRSWSRVTRGTYLPTGTTDVVLAARATAADLPRGTGFGHLTSAALREWWLPNGLDPVPVLFATTVSRVHVQRHGLYVRRSDYTQVELLDGTPVTSAPDTLLELAQDLSLVDLVPLVDCALRGGASPADLMAAARPRSRGARMLRRAVPLGDPRSESWWESVLRLMHVVAGVGPVQCQVDLTSGGEFVARADLHLVGTNRYPECDGGEHRDRERHGQDLRRDKAMHRMGAERYGYTTAEIAQRPEMIIRDAEEARGWRPDPTRPARWRTMAASSTLTGHGRARLRARLLRYRSAARR